MGRVLDGEYGRPGQGYPREMAFYKGRTEKNLDSKGLRMLIFGAESDGSRVLLGCAVKDARIVETTA